MEVAIYRKEGPTWTRGSRGKRGRSRRHAPPELFKWNSKRASCLRLVSELGGGERTKKPYAVHKVFLCCSPARPRPLYLPGNLTPIYSVYVRVKSEISRVNNRDIRKPDDLQKLDSTCVHE